ILQAESQRILERVRTHSGDRAPTRLRVVQGKAARAEPGDTTDVKKRQSASHVSETVETSPEARLLSALDRFAKSVKARDGH
ncbi:hypothetical protein, partial [Leifsonia sp. SIMBA_070]|uniref:hypothetical protein n=1 Tax=Leifsonia sp. SIMBA_070 TaxID=3085810 RepID=UPI0039786ADA